MSEMKIRVTIEEKTLVMHIRGRVTATNASQIVESIKEHFRNFTDIQVDAAELEYISSAGLRQFVQLNSIAQSKGGRFRIINVNDIVKELLEDVGLFDSFCGT